MRALLSFLIMILVIQSAYSLDWKQQLFSEDETAKYYVCIGESEISDAKAIESATDECYRTAIADNFGVQAEILQQTLETDSQSNLRVKKNIQSSRVKLNSFERTNLEVSKHSGTFRAFIRYQYSKAAIHDEKMRLAQMGSGHQLSPDEMIEPSFMNSSGDLKYNTNLSIETIPARSRVLIDDEQIGYTNLKLDRILRPGVYKIKMEKEGFEDHEMTIELKENKPERISVKLSILKIRLSFETTPDDAKVYVNNKLLKNNDIDVLYGDEINIKASRANCADLQILKFKINSLTDFQRELTLVCEASITKKEIPIPIEPTESISDRLQKAFSGTNLKVHFAIGYGVNVLSEGGSSSETYGLKGIGHGLEVFARLDSLYFEVAAHNYASATLNSVTTKTGYSQTDRSVKLNSKRIKAGLISDSGNGNALGISLFTETSELDNPVTYYTYPRDSVKFENDKRELSSMTQVALSFDVYSFSKSGNAVFRMGGHIGLSQASGAERSNSVLGLTCAILLGAGN